MTDVRAIVRVSSKGQLTLPKAFRDKLDLTAGSYLEFKIVGDEVHVMKADGQPE